MPIVVSGQFQLLDCGEGCRQNGAMSREEVLRSLRAHEPDLRAAGVDSLSLFGSVARGEPDPSDVDLAVRLNSDFSSGGFDYFWQKKCLEEKLTEILGCHVDVVEEPVREERFQMEIDRDRAVAF